MAPSKQQAKRSRQAVSAKKRAPHGGSRSRSAAAVTMPVTANGNGRTSLRTSAAADIAATDDLARPAGVLAWMRTHPLPLTTWVLSLLALGVSIYLTITHYDTSVTLACSDKGIVNCAKVTTSSQSMVFGIFPVAVLGLAFFVFMVAVTTPWAWRSQRREIALARLGSVIIGVGFILYLIYVEVYQVAAICLWCTSVHVITFLLFGLIALTAAVWGLVPREARQAG